LKMGRFLSFFHPETPEGADPLLCGSDCRLLLTI
jgi:hypothetical protein